MKKVFNSAIALILCISMIFSGAVVAFAADVGTPTVTVSLSSGTDVKITWGSVSGADGYWIERSTKPDSGWDDIKKTVTGTEYTDSGRTPGETYYYRVRAYQKSGFLNLSKEYGEFSEPVKAVIDPAQVSGLKNIINESGAKKITITWDAAEGAKGYQIYMLDPATNQYKRVATTSKRTYVAKNLTERTTYKFKVRAYHKLNGVRYGNFSEELSVTTTLADVENFRIIESGMTKYTIAWDPNPNVIGFQLAKYDTAEGEWKIIRFDGQLYTTKTSYSVTGVAEGSNDMYKIRTYTDSKTYGSWSDVVYGGTLPKAPTNLKVAANTDNGVTVIWNGVTGSAGYEIYCKDETGNWKSVGTTDRTTFNHNNLMEEKYYEYKVRAYVGSAKNPMYGNFGETVKIFYEPVPAPDEVYSEDWEKTGILGYLYDPKEQCFYTADDTWQRNFGYSEIYDNAASLVVIIIETCRLKFEYADRDWMIQLWKGQYGWVLYGAEIGIYNKEKSRPVEHYTCANDEDMLQMSMVLWEKSKSAMGGSYWTRTFGRPYERQWWHTGFVIGNMIGRYDNDLKMEARITMRDFEMLEAFKGALLSEGFIDVTSFSWTDALNLKDNPNCFRISGLDVYFYWT